MKKNTLATPGTRRVLTSAIAVAITTVLIPGLAWADCTVIGATVQCNTTSTTDTTYPVNAPLDRNYTGVSATPFRLAVNPGATVNGNGLAVSNTGIGGVTVDNEGAIIVNAGNTPTAGGTAALSVSAAGGNIIYAGSGSISNNGNGNAFNVQTAGTGFVDIDLDGDVFAATGNGVVVRDTATNTGISVETNNVSALTAGMNAIDVQSASLTGDVTVIANRNVQAGNVGIVGTILPPTANGDIDITANGAIDARAGIEATNLGTGNVRVATAGPITATTGNGILAQSTGGTVTVNANNVTSSGNTAILAQQTNVAGAGAVNVTARNVSGTTGIFANNLGTGNTTVNANGTVTGTTLEGILVRGNNAVTVDVANTVTGATRGMTLVGGTGGTGNILVTGNGGFVGGSGDAANILNNGTGTVTVNVAGASSSTAGEGFVVRDTALGGDISVTTDAVTALAAGQDAIDVRTLSANADVTVVANGNLRAGNTGIVATVVPVTGTGDINVTSNGSIDARSGIEAVNLGTGTVRVTTVGPITATTGNGILAQSTGGTVTVNSNNVTSSGNTAILAQQTNVAGAGAVNVTARNVSGTTGIFANNLGTGTTTVNANGTVTGTALEGILVRGNNAVSVNVANTVTGATRGMTLVGGTGGTGNISVTGNGGFVGGTGDAANILNNGTGTVTVNVAGASSSTAGEGFVVRDTALGGDISVNTGAVTALAAGQDAIDVRTLSANADVTVVANGNLRAGNTGIVATVVPVTGTGDINVTSNGSIDARSGIEAINLGRGTVRVTTVGPITATTGNGILAQSTGGAVTVNANNVTSSGNTAILAQQTNVAGTGAVNITARNVSGTTGILVNNLGTGATTINANGTTTGTAGPSINANGSAATVNVSSSGTVNGFIDLTDNADRVNNNGLFNATGTSLFGLGNDLFNNTSRINVFNGATTFSGLETLSNSGTISMVDGVANDTLSISGNYVGVNGTLLLDTVLGDDASLSDRLVVGGSTSGYTGITVNNVGGLGTFTTGDGIMVVNVAGPSAANAFGLNNSLRAGAFNYNLYQNGIANPLDGDWYLRSTARGITPAAMVVPLMANQSALMMLGSFHERLGARGTEMDESGAWARIVGNFGTQTHQSNIGSFHGHNDSVAIQAGADIHTSESGMRFGAYASGSRSNTRLFDRSNHPHNVTGRSDTEGYAIGGYATQFGDNYYWDAVIQYSVLDAEVSGDGDRFDTQSKNLLGSFEFGYAFKFGDKNAIEPQVQIIAGKGSTDASNDGFTNYNYDDEDTLLARLGVRWIHSKDQGNIKGSFVPYVKANVWRNFGDDSLINIGPSTISTQRDDTWAEVGLGFSVLTQHDWSIFMQYDYEKGIGKTDRTNHSGTIGFRRSW